jgi:hypothetical protein
VYIYIPNNSVRYSEVMLAGIDAVCGIYLKYAPNDIVIACSDIYSCHCVETVLFMAHVSHQ